MSRETFVRDALKRPDGLFELVYRYNVGLGEYVDESYLEDGFLKEHWVDLLESERGRRGVSRYLEKALGVGMGEYYGFEEPRLRMLLLDGTLLKRLMMYAGGALYGEKMSKVVMKEKVLKMKEEIGENVYFFSTKRAGVLLKIRPKVELRDGDIGREALEEAGKACFEMCYGGEDEGLLKRFMLKFPKEMKWNFEQYGDGSQRMGAWSFLSRILLKELKPKEAACFT